MFCPECGFDAQDARFCPECGAGLDRFRSSIDVDDFDDAPRREARPAARTSGALGGKRSGGSRQPARGPRPRAAARASEEYREPSRPATESVSYTHLRAHETRHDLVCRLLLEKK